MLRTMYIYIYMYRLQYVTAYKIKFRPLASKVFFFSDEKQLIYVSWPKMFRYARSMICTCTVYFLLLVYVLHVLSLYSIFAQLIAFTSVAVFGPCTSWPAACAMFFFVLARTPDQFMSSASAVELHVDGCICVSNLNTTSWVLFVFFGCN